MCNQLRFHHQLGINIWRLKFLRNKETVFSLCFIPETRVTRILIRSSWVSRVMDKKYKHETWKRHQNGVYWVDINVVLNKGLKLYQTGLNAVIHYDTLPAYCIPKTIMMGYVEIIDDKVHASLRFHVCSFFRLFDWIKLDPQNANQVHRHKNQLAGELTNGTFTLDEWNHLWSLCNMNQFMSTVCFESIANILQQESGEERVTAKSRPKLIL